MARALLTLTTDFGASGYFTGAMKGVIKSIAPGAEIVDITHEIPPYRIEEAAFIFDRAWRCFPGKTIHVVVVDPGVGTSRRPILVQAAGQSFVAPDNGVLGAILSREKCAVREITAARYFRQPVSQTFHGRDVFAPAAAYLAKGTPAARFGPKIGDAFRPALAAVQRTGKRTWSGCVLQIDRFGNLITSLPAADFARIKENPFELAVGLERVTLFAANYEQAAPGELFAIEGSAGMLEVSVNRGSAAALLKVGTGAPVEITVW